MWNAIGSLRGSARSDETASVAQEPHDQAARRKRSSSPGSETTRSGEIFLARSRRMAQKTRIQAGKTNTSHELNEAVSSPMATANPITMNHFGRIPESRPRFVVVRTNIAAMRTSRRRGAARLRTVSDATDRRLLLTARW